MGPHSITATYKGSSSFLTSSASLNPLQTVNQDATTTALDSSANPSVFGVSVTFTATVTASDPGSGTPTGTVTFMDGTTLLKTVNLSGGSASFSTSKLAIGSHSITANYNGSASYATSMDSLTQQVNSSTPSLAMFKLLGGSSEGSGDFGSLRQVSIAGVQSTAGPTFDVVLGTLAQDGRAGFEIDSVASEQILAKRKAN